MARSNVRGSLAYRYLRCSGSRGLQTSPEHVEESNFQIEAGSHPLFLQLHTYSGKAFTGSLITLWYLCGPLCLSRFAHLHHWLLPCAPDLSFCTVPPSFLAALSQPTWFHWKAETGSFLQSSFFLSPLFPSFSFPLIFMYCLRFQDLRKLKFQIIFRGD